MPDSIRSGSDQARGNFQAVVDADDEKPWPGLRHEVHRIHNHGTKTVISTKERSAYRRKIFPAMRCEGAADILKNDKSGSAIFLGQRLYEVPKRPERT